MTTLPPVRLPHGVRDYLPAAAAERRRIAEGLLATFERWGYRRIITPAFEYESVLARGLGPSAQTQAVRFVEPLSGEVVALRPDITPQVARLVATRFADEPGPIRLSYEGSVVRMGSGASPQRELFQAGIELIESPSPAGDVEVIALAASALAASGIADFTLDLGEAQVARAALDGIADLPLRQAIARKDAEAVARIARELELPAPRQKLLAALPTLYGGPEVIDRALALVPKGEARTGLQQLATVVEQLGELHLAGHLSVDLGEVRGFDYYTGIRFQGLAPGAGEALLSGGRYDRLIERYGRAARAAGFAVDVERIALSLRALDVVAPPNGKGVYLAGELRLRHPLAKALRRAGVRVAEEVGEPFPPTAKLAARLSAAGLDVAIVLSGAREPAKWIDGNGGSGKIPAPVLSAFIAGSVGVDALLPKR
jgi:ATP phosphoribosyltransferase regulatory subunit